MLSRRGRVGYSIFDMRPFDRVVIKVWSRTMTGRIL